MPMEDFFVVWNICYPTKMRPLDKVTDTLALKFQRVSMCDKIFQIFNYFYFVLMASSFKVIYSKMSGDLKVF